MGSGVLRSLHFVFTVSLCQFIVFDLPANNITGSLAIDCLTVNSTDGSSYAGSIFLTRQYDADILLGNCTTVVGDLYVEPDYAGSLNISTLTNITGALWLQSAELTSVSIDELLYLSQLQTIQYDSLTSLSMSRLLEVNNLGISSSLPMNASFPSLVNATGILMGGNYSR